jgi:glycosyltransferase involved in cell wall biosynthesis
MVDNKERDDSPSILVLVPALDEEEGIGLTLVELKKYLSDSCFLVVDGNSKDQTVHSAKSHGADVLCQQGKGKGDAIGFALGHVERDFDYVVLIDADYTYPAEYARQMIKILESNPEVGMICGNRFNSHLNLGSMRDIFYFGNRIIAFMHNLLNGIALRDPLTGLRVIRWSAVRAWQPKSTGFDIEVELNHHVEKQGFTIKELDIPYRVRVGEKKLKLRHGFSILERILSESLC